MSYILQLKHHGICILKKKKSWCIQIVFFLNTHPNKNLYSKNVVIIAMLTKLSKNPFLGIL